MPTRAPTHRPPRPALPCSDPRPSAYRRGYGKRWQRLRLMVLAEEPLCRECAKEGRATEATDVDHIIPRPEGDDSRANLQPLCGYHHRVKTARQDGAFGRRVVPKEER